MSAKMAGMNDIERLEKEVQTTKASCVVSTRHICKPLLSLSFCHYWVVVSSNYAVNCLTCDVYMMCELFQSR
uniref:Ovule protein n=1 Tax=Mesocestoides corti TaxID=53468 RepID=A0A5K3G4S7_MESCO